MASRRKKFRPATKTRSSREIYAEFMRALLAEEIDATLLIATGGTRARPEFDYVDPIDRKDKRP